MKRLKATPENIAGVDAATRKMLADAATKEAKTRFIKLAGAGLCACLILAGAGALLWGAASFFPPKPAAPAQPAEREITLVLPFNPASENPRPTDAQFKVNPASKSQVNVVVFRRTQHGKGEVQTGGLFLKPTDALPSTQWCLYREVQSDRTTLSITIGAERKKIDPPNPSPFPDVDLNKTYSLCDFWPLPPAPSPHASNE
jgi:hypothetical protein